MRHPIERFEDSSITQSVDQFSAGLVGYLETLGLPAESVLVCVDERRQVINNMPAVVRGLSSSQRQSAMYISKFVAACASGLFDAALNYLWDETIHNLRSKVARFDLEYFYDSTVTDPDRRKKLRDEADLEKLDDWELIRGCRETGMITDTGFRHLDYIRDMRNHASAAHPNHNELTGLQVAAWLQTCIREVLGKEPEGPVIEVRKLLRSLRQEVLSKADIPPIARAVEHLSEDLSRSLLRTVLGMFTDAKLDAEVRSNLRLVAPEVWRVCTTDARYEAGLKQATLSANGEVSRAKLAREFLELVDGLTYLPPDALAVEVSSVLDTLLTVHNGWHNFYNEPPHARVLQSRVPASGAMPKSVAGKYVRVLTMCRIGNGYGVSEAAVPVYDDLIGRWQDAHIRLFLRLVGNSEVVSRLQFGSCAKNFQRLAAALQEQTSKPLLERALQFLAEFPPDKLHAVRKDSRFQQIVKDLG